MPPTELRPFDAKFPSGQAAFRFPGFSFPEGAYCLLVGASGAGKTTILNHLRHHPQDILVGEEPQGSILLEQMYEPLLFPYQPVWWNVAIPSIIREQLPEDAAKDVTKKLLDGFALSLDIDRYPADLSGGEKHLVLLARLALCEQRVLLIDEPTTGLDREREALVWATIGRLIDRHNKRVILVSHDPPPIGEHLSRSQFVGVLGATINIEAIGSDGRQK